MSEEDKTVFAAPTPAAQPVVTPPATPSLPPELVEFVGTGKKYATAEEALKSVPHAQKHISTIEAELAAAKAELEKRKTTEQLLEEIKNSGITPTSTTSTNLGLSQAEITALIDQSISQKESQVIAQTNISKVTSTFTEKFGEKAEEVYINIAKESGLSVQYLNQLAATSPSAVLKLAGLEMKPTVPTPTKPTGTVNTEGLQPNDGTSSLSAKVKTGASTKDLVSAWKIAGQKVGKPT